MKKLAIAIVAVLATVSAYAQPEAGTWSITPKIGLNASYVTGSDLKYTGGIEGISTVKMEPLTTIGGVIGAEAGYQLNKRIGLTAGLLYSEQGFEYDGSVSQVGKGELWRDKSDIYLGYINVPILANFYIVKGLAVKAGLQPGFLVSAKHNYDMIGNKKKEDIKDGCNTVDLSIPVGVSYEFNFGLILDARYNIGVTNVYKDIDGCNSVFQLTAGWKFNL